MVFVRLFQSQLTDDVKKVGTLSYDEWEALNIYTVFAFKKMNEIGGLSV